MTTREIVIVGAGQSAARAALALREGGFQGRIIMLGREPYTPYERPPLSKALLVADEEPRLDVLDAQAWTRCAVELVTGAEAIRLDPARQQIQLADGTVITYDRCLLATGGEARTLACAPTGAPGIHYLRTLDDARRLKQALRRRPQVAVLGGGFLGLEIAHSALAAGASVTLLEYAPSLLARFLPPEASRWVEGTLRSEGARLMLGASVAAARVLDTGRIQLETSDGATLEVDDVVVAIGMAPNDSLAREAGLAVAPAGGILVDAHCRTSDPHVFACGDCASQRRDGQGEPTRMESWQNANEQARMAAAAMLDSASPTPPYPWFWTDQGRHNLQMLGLPANDLEYVRRGNPAADKALWIGHRNGVPVHGVALNAGGELRAVRPLYERGRPVALHEFHDDALNLRAWAKQAMSEAGALFQPS